MSYSVVLSTSKFHEGSRTALFCNLHQSLLFVSLAPVCLGDRFAPAAEAFAHFRGSTLVASGGTLFTEVLPGGQVAIRKDRPALVVSSTR
jgi:hypothetical protein